MAVRMVRRWMWALPLLFLILAGCAPLEERVDLTYETSVNAKGGSGEVFVSQPAMDERLQALPSGRKIVGKSGDADIVIGTDPAAWLLQAMVQELSAAGYEVKTVAALPPSVRKGVRPSIVSLSAQQSSDVVTVVTIAEVKLEAQVWKDGKLLKTLTSGAQDHEEGLDRSSEPIREALEKTLQRALEGLVPEIVEALKQDSSEGRRGAPINRSPSQVSASLFQWCEVVPSVLGPRCLVMAWVERLLFSVGDGFEAALCDSEAHEIVLRRICPLLAEDEVVLNGAPLIAVPLDPHPAGLGREPLVVLLEHLGIPWPYVILVEIEVDVG